MIAPSDFYAALAEAGVTFMTGVPDSLLKEFCAYVDAALPPSQHVIAANEGAAVGIAAGFHLATGDLPVVYMQNSGLGNAVNPVLSLSDTAVYAIPMILVVGWRGEPGVKDEPQHVKQGAVTPAMLEAMGIPYRVLSGEPAEAMEIAKWAASEATSTSGPVCILVRKGAFDKSSQKRPAATPAANMLAREAAIAKITGALPTDATVVATTGMISRELYEQRVAQDQDRSSDFLTVGSMGHASQIALGISIGKPDARVVCIDGDGAALMHMGSLAITGTNKDANILHVLLNNGVHDSVGGQPTVGFEASFTDVARACGYPVVEGPLVDETEITEAVERLAAMTGPRFLEVRVKPGSRADLGRPKETPAENKAIFVKRLRG